MEMRGCGHANTSTKPCPLQVDEVERSDCRQAKCSRQHTLWTRRACSPHPSTETKAFTEACTYTKSVTSAHVGEMHLAIVRIFFCQWLLEFSLPDNLRPCTPRPREPTVQPQAQRDHSGMDTCVWASVPKGHSWEPTLTGQQKRLWGSYHSGVASEPGAAGRALSLSLCPCQEGTML